MQTTLQNSATKDFTNQAYIYSDEVFPVYAYDPTVLCDHPPIITSNPSTLKVTVGQPYSYTVLATDEDADTIKYYLDAKPAGMTIDQSTGVIAWTPAADQVGKHTVTIRAQSLTLAAQQIITLDVIGPPVFISTPKTTALIGRTYNYSIAATTTSGLGITYSLVTAPAGMQVNGSVVSWTPATTDAGLTYDVVIKATSGTLSSTQSYKLLVDINHAPTVSKPTDQSSTVGGEVSFQILASDPDNDELYYTATGLPSGLGIDYYTGIIMGKAATTVTPGTFPVTVTVKDPSNAAVTTTFYWIITNGTVNSPPVLATIANQTLTEDTAATVTLSATDADGDAISYTVSGGSAATVAASISGATLTLTPAANYTTATAISFTVTANDGKGGTNSRSFTVTVGAVNDAPSVTNPGAQTGAEGAAVSLQVSASDLDGNTLTYSATSLPTGLAINSATGLISGTLGYTAAGSYTAKVTVTDGTAPVTVSFGWTVTNTNQVPAFTSTPLTSATEAKPYSYTPTASDVDGDTLAYSLTVAPTGMTITNGVITWTPTAAQSGTHNVTVRVSDGTATADQSFIITVSKNNAPTFTSTPATTATEGGAYSYSAKATDADGDTITYSLVAPPMGMTIITSTGAISWTPTYDQADSYPVTVRATDSRGASADQTYTLTVANMNQAPTITKPASQTSNEGTTVSLQLQATDADGDLLTYGATGLPPGLTIDSTTGLISGTLGYSAAGTYNITVTAKDATTTATATFTWTVNNANREPIITAPANQTSVEGAAVSLQVIATDPDGDALTYGATGLPAGLTINSSTGVISGTLGYSAAGSYNVTVTAKDATATATVSFTWTVTNTDRAPAITSAAVTTANVGTAYSYTVAANDPDGDAISYTLTTAPATMTISNAGVINWTPAADQTGTQNVVVTITAGGQTATQTFTITVNNQVVNQAPAITSQPVTTAYKDGYYYYQVTASDPNGDAVSYSLTTRPSGMTINATTGIIYWRPQDRGTYSVTVKTSDPSGLSTSQSFKVSVVERPSNSSPRITSTAVTKAVVDTLYSYDVNATDSNGDIVYFRLSSAPSGMTIDLATGLISWTPTASQTGSKYVNVEALDTKGGKTSQSFYIAVSQSSNTNSPPVIASTPVTTATVGSSYSYDVNATDADGDIITYSLVTPPTGMTINATTGVISWTPATDQAGTQNVIVTVTAGGQTATQTFTITVSNQVVNKAPVVTSQPVTTAYKDGYYYYQVVASDPNGDAVSYSLTTRPSGMTINATTGIIYWRPGSTGTYSVTVKASDPSGLSTSQSFKVSVVERPSNSSPRITSTAVTKAVVDTLYSYDVNATDSNGDTVYFRLSSAPSGMTIDLDSGLITWTPTASQTGSKYVKVEVIDSKGGRTSQSFYVTVSLAEGAVSASSVNSCDVTDDGLVTADDIKMIIEGRETGNLNLDIDGDGSVTLLDARKCTLEMQN
ncbi:putative Ig domain-containing protein [Geobacter sp.]|uniref:putative Ig domain-containing protein n=1 Tax=Geobacter sp. TaxID=46610 RepID=UPI0035A03B1B